MARIRGSRRLRFDTGVLVGFALLACGPPQAVPQTNSFGGLFVQLSEPSGFFDTDNLISNERSYLHPVDELAARGVQGGAYIGVGPDQNFSYIAAIRPAVAYILDIRRDNALEHFLFKALFALAPTRVEYLSALFGRAPPAAPTARDTLDIEAIVAQVDGAPADPAYASALRGRVDSVIATFGVQLSGEDWATIDRFHRAFMAAGPNLRFQSFGRAPRSYYPTYRDLLLERTREGRRASFLASRDAYDFVRRLQAADRIVPVVGDFAGGHALRAIGRDIERRGLRVSAFYTSNVEFYLYRDGTMGTFVRNVAALPLADGSVVIRSLFLSSYPYDHPDARSGYGSVQLLQPIRRMVEGYGSGEFRRYRDLVR